MDQLRESQNEDDFLTTMNVCMVETTAQTKPLTGMSSGQPQFIKCGKRHHSYLKPSVVYVQTGHNICTLIL